MTSQISTQAATTPAGEYVSADTVRLQVDGGVASLTLGSGSQRNALGVAAWRRLQTLAQDIARADRVKVVLVRGAGSTFSAGSDIREWRGSTPAEVDASFEAMEAALEAVEDIPVPTVAVVEGVAAGAGCQLALACDLRVMAATGRLGMPILRLGILPSPLFALRLSALAGPARARELLFTGRLIDAEQAERYGLATHVVDDRDLDAQVATLVDTLVQQPRTGLVSSKAATGLEHARLREDHRRPDWNFSDPSEFPDRILSFFADDR